MSVKTRGGASDKSNNFPLILYEIQKHCLKYQSYFQNILKNYLFLSLLFAFWMIKQCRLVPMLTGHIFDKSRVFSKRQRLFEKHLSCGIWTFTTTERGGADYLGKRKSRKKWSEKRKSRKNQRQSAAEIEVLSIRNSIIIYCFSQVLNFLADSIRHFAIS